ncbi:MAG: serine/threonine protein kinase [Proteobacteria bacterium]|jgi:serine/threonine protein kinase|nr:serine/threonine protein kinase [Pseudomonadota bacterium]
MICARCGEHTNDTPCSACEESPLLAAQFRLESVLGEGPAGTTYKASCQSDGATVVIKEMSLRKANLDKSGELFEREVRVLQQLEHDQIPGYIDHFVAGTGKSRALYLVQEFIEGVDLAQELESHRYSENEVLEIIAGILPVLSYIHSLSPPVIHRDLKPRNVMRRQSDGKLVLVDFGAVRDALKGKELGGSTVAGTFGYMAPEQFQGEATAATDLYGLGALAVALLTRKEPHNLLDHLGVIQWHEHTKVSPGVVTLLGHLLEPDLRWRPEDAAGVLEFVNTVRTNPNGPPPYHPVMKRESPQVAPRATTSVPRAKVKEKSPAAGLFEPEGPPDLPAKRPPPANSSGKSQVLLMAVSALLAFSLIMFAALGLGVGSLFLVADQGQSYELSVPVPAEIEVSTLIPPPTPAPLLEPADEVAVEHIDLVWSQSESKLRQSCYKPLGNGNTYDFEADFTIATGGFVVDPHTPNLNNEALEQCIKNHIGDLAFEPMNTSRTVTKKIEMRP